MDELLRSTLQTQPSHVRRTLAVMGVLHRPAGRSDLARILRDAGVRDEKKRQISTTDLLELLEGWRTLGLVCELASGTWRVRSEVMHPLAVELAERNELEAIAEQVRRIEPLAGRYYEVRAEYLARELFLALYLPACEGLEGALREYDQRRGVGDDVYLMAYGVHMPLEAMHKLEPERARRYLSCAFGAGVEALLPVGHGVLPYVEAVRGVLPSDILARAAQFLAMRGEYTSAAKLVEGRDDEAARAALAFVAFASGDLPTARAHARTAVELTRAKSSKRIKGLLHPLWSWTTLLLITDQSDPASLALGTAQLEVSRKKHRAEATTLEALCRISAQLNGADPRRFEDHWWVAEQVVTWSEVLIWSTALHAADRTPGARLNAQRAALRAMAQTQGFTWLVEQLAPSALLQLTQREPGWQRSLRALEQAVQLGDTSLDSPPKHERIVWVLQLYAGQPALTPRLQTSKGDRYTGGRAVSLKKLVEAHSEDPLLDEHDRRVLRGVVEVRDPSGWGTLLQFEPEAALALVGHPRVFADVECSRPLLVERGRPTIQVHPREDGGWVVEAEPRDCAKVPVLGMLEAEGSMHLYALTPDQRRVIAQLPVGGLRLPPEAREQAQQTLAKVGSLFSMSSALELSAPEIIEVEADPRIYVQLRRARAGIRLALCVAPLGNAVRMIPGQGNPVTIGTSDAKTLRCMRDLARERSALDRVRAACPTLSQHGDEQVLLVPTLIECLELLSDLQALGDEVVVEWPEGEPLRVTAQRELSQLRVRVQDEGAWLSAEGELPVDAELTLSFRALVSGAHPRHGRFVALDDGRYLALSESLLRSIEAAEALARIEGERVALHPLAMLALTQLDEAALEPSGEVAARLTRAREAASLTPEVPPTFQATLRPYQADGFRFLRRLAHWGAGACLADDMGLGKTLQTLALLVDRAPLGPAIVVAPTTVCANWCDEARKFAPTLRVKQLTTGDRERTLRELGPFDLLVCSYGVLQQERERLAAVSFETAVLDEAQAIKNARTQRARAACELDAKQRIALTGTPVENHLGELWSILQFVNSGLLGSEREFEQRFARPIQRDGDKQCAQLLRRIVSPFLLRRKKSDVLDDLPPKTEITLRVEPSAEEQALFTALREEALVRVGRRDQPAQARMQLFAELMRMRRAACHPALVLPDTALDSSKLAALETLLSELRDNGHRALVFSQFVDYLQLVRARLDALGMRYQYLDGSSSSVARSESTKAFQAGEGDVFLISLKAGGFGLNLTAADYVVHLDPWWNPAVEDQASDRAHRIGQTRPVTIYRLVMQGSIEEKILALHASKRELADDLLAGGGGSLDADELLSLLVEVHGPQAAAEVSAQA